MDSLEAFSGTYAEQLVNRAQQRKVPISGTFELTPVCNMRCRMCYIQHTPKREELQPYEFWADVLDQAMAQGLLFPLLTGGEPLLYPEFDRLYERLAAMPLHLCLNTNATLLTRERVAFLAKNPPRRINISLYGASDETYARLCGNPNGLTQVLHAFDLLKEYDISFRVHSVLVPENAVDYQGIVDICNRYRVPMGSANYMFPSYRKEEACAQAHDRLTPKELAEHSLLHLRSHYRGREKEYRLYVGQRCAAFERPELYSLYGSNEVVCRAGSCVFWVDWRGHVSGCGMHNQGGVDLHTTPFEQAWKTIVEDTRRIRLSEKCRFCKYRCICQNCAAAAFCETGAMDGTPEYLCAYCEEYARLLLAERSRIREG